MSHALIFAAVLLIISRMMECILYTFGEFFGRALDAVFLFVLFIRQGSVSDFSFLAIRTNLTKIFVRFRELVKIEK